MKDKPKGPSMKQVAKNYKKNVKVKTKATNVMNYQTGTNPRMDKMVSARMGMPVAPNSSYTGPMIETSRSIRKTAKPMSMTVGTASATRGGTKTIKRAKRK